MEITLIAKCDRCKEAKLLDFNSPIDVYDILRSMGFVPHSVIDPIPNTDKTTTRNVYLCSKCDKQLTDLRKQAKDNEAAFYKGFYKGEEPCT